jgi:hypothetical protein
MTLTTNTTSYTSTTITTTTAITLLKRAQQLAMNTLQEKTTGITLHAHDALDSEHIGPPL